ncbi:hypothetical protein [Pleurochrysis sp. Polinton-like virus]|nr:hypothetical protein [Pleurochrysis sp. Polinton-like virus]
MTIVPYTSTTASRVVSDTVGIVTFKNGTWVVVGEGGEEPLLSDFLDGQLTDGAFLLFSSTNPLLLTTIDLPFVSSLNDLLDVNTSGVTVFQFLTFVNDTWKSGVFYNGFDFKLGAGPFVVQYIGRFSIHIGSLPGLKSQLGVETLAMGHECGTAQDGNWPIAMGYRACFAGSQMGDGVAIGSQCAILGQDDFATSVGYKACFDARQAERSVAFGNESGAYGTSCVCIGSKARCTYKDTIVFSASDSVFEGQSADSFYIDPQNVSAVKATDTDLGGEFLAYNSSSGKVLRFALDTYLYHTPGVDSNTTPVTVSRVADGEYLVVLDVSRSYSVYDLTMHSTVIGHEVNVSIVHKQSGNNLTIYVARDGLPSNDDVFEFVVSQPVLPVMRAIIGGPSILYKLDTFFQSLI